MRYSGSEKYEIIRLVEQPSLSVKQTLSRLDIHRSTFYAWLKRYEAGGIDALEDRKPVPRSAWNKLSEDEQVAIVDLALEKPALSPLGNHGDVHGRKSDLSLNLPSIGSSKLRT